MNDKASPTDRRNLYPAPPFAKQPQPAPGLAQKMDPTPDHKEEGYRGSGRLAGRKGLVTGCKGVARYRPEMTMIHEENLKQIQAGVLDIAYFELGPAEGVPTILLHGFPYDAHAYNGVASNLAASGHRCIVPFLRGYGATRFLSPKTPRSGEQAALGADLLSLINALGIEKAILGGYDWGGRAACIVAALWPERVIGLVSAGTGYNIQNIAGAANPGAPDQEARDWYQYYFHTDGVGRALASSGVRSAGFSGRHGRRPGRSTMKRSSAAPQRSTIQTSWTSSSILIAIGTASFPAIRPMPRSKPGWQSSLTLRFPP